jgi:hypothetical protein
MRAVWVDEGNDANYDLLRKHGITWAYFSLQDPSLLRRLQDVRARGLVGGVYAAWNWFPGSGADFAEAVHQTLRAKVPDATNTWPRVMLNDETHSVTRIFEMIQRWRTLRPQTATSWTLEGHQGGWARTPALVKACVDAKIRVVPQAYSGPMIPTDALACVRDLTTGYSPYPDVLVTPFYDGSALQPWWQGFVFTQGRLP